MPRYAVKASEQDLVDLLLKTLKKWDEDSYEDVKEDMDDNVANGKDLDVAFIFHSALGYLGSSVKVMEDISKIEFDIENLDIEEYVQTPGYDYLLAYAGGDWETPIYFAIYSDGKTLRGYVPEEGNFYDKKNKRAFGNSDDVDAEALYILQAYGLMVEEHADIETGEPEQLEKLKEAIAKRIEAKK